VGRWTDRLIDRGGVCVVVAVFDSVVMSLLTGD
jgi:hypothetical protein